MLWNHIQGMLEKRPYGDVAVATKTNYTELEGFILAALIVFF